MVGQAGRGRIEGAARGSVISAGAAEPDGVDGEVVVRVQLRVALGRAEGSDAFWRFRVKLAPDFNKRSAKKCQVFTNTFTLHYIAVHFVSLHIKHSITKFCCI